MRRILLGFTMLALLASCASMLPTQTVNGVAVYIRPPKEVDTFCRAHVTADQIAPGNEGWMYGCYIPKDNTIMVRPDEPETLAHELRHAAGWSHRGPCHSSAQFPNGLKPNGMACEWYR
jgi:hypothetical protein